MREKTSISSGETAHTHVHPGQPQIIRGCLAILFAIGKVGRYLPLVPKGRQGVSRPTIDGFVRKGPKISQNCTFIIHFVETEIFSQCYNVLRIIMQ